MSTNEVHTDLLLIALYQDHAAIGVRQLESFLIQRGYEVHTLFFKGSDDASKEPTELEIKLLLDFVEQMQPSLIGLSVMSPFKPIAVRVTEDLRAAYSIPIIWGGIHTTICPDDSIGFADAIICGEAEMPLAEIIEYVRQNGSVPEDIANTWVRKEGSIIKNEITFRNEDLDTLPFPDLSGQNKHCITNDQLHDSDPGLGYIREHHRYVFKAFRGCPYDCSYCCNGALRRVCRGDGTVLRKRSVSHVMAELTLAIETFPEIELIHSNDEVFIMDREYVRDFCEQYKRQIGLPLTCDIHLNLLDEEALQWLVDAGLCMVAAGIEAFSERVRIEVYKREQSNEMIVEKARLLGLYGIWGVYDFIYDNPLESADDMARCFRELIVRLPRRSRFNSYSLCHLPGTRLTQQFLEEGIISEEDVVGVSRKGMEQWKVTQDYSRNPRILFWLTIYHLYGFHVADRFPIPKFLLAAVAASNSYFIARCFSKCVSLLGAFLKALGMRASVQAAPCNR